MQVLILHPPRKLALSSNCIEKITNLNGLSESRVARTGDERQSHGIVKKCVITNVLLSARVFENPFSWTKPHKEFDWLGELLCPKPS